MMVPVPACCMQSSQQQEEPGGAKHVEDFFWNTITFVAQIDP